MPAIYNEIDPYAAEWMENLERAGHIAPGIIDRRNIRELQPQDIEGYTQFHAFGGIGVWSHALRLAGWADDVSVWTGSCPCQPFSSAGKKQGFDDPRHIWPEWFRLIRECRPAVLFGEQVASADGRRWFDVVSADMEGLDYAVGAASLPACGVGAPHLRQRLFFVAYSDSERLTGLGWSQQDGSPGSAEGGVAQRGEVGDMALAGGERCEEFGLQLRGRGSRSEVFEASGCCSPSSLADAAICGPVKGSAPGSRTSRQGGARPADIGELGNPGSEGGGRHSGAVPCTEGEGEGREVGSLSHEFVPPGATHGFWADAEWIPCRDGKRRAVKSGLQCVVAGTAGRVAVVRTNGQAEGEKRWYNRSGALKGIGNCIVPQVAAVFVRAAMECMS